MGGHESKGETGNLKAMKKSPTDDVSAQEMRNSVVIRLKAFSDEFERLARTARQGILAGRFGYAVNDEEIAPVPLIAADLEPLAEWMKGYGDGFAKLARTPQEKKLVASFREFIDELTSPAIIDAFQRPLVNGLVAEMKSVMARGSSEGVPFASLTQEGKQAFLSSVIDWTEYIDRGLIVGSGDEHSGDGIQRIIDNAIAGKPSEQWMGQPDPLAKGEAGKTLEQRFEKIETMLRDASQRAGQEQDRGIDR